MPCFLDGGLSPEYGTDPTEEAARMRWKEIRAKAEMEQEELRLERERSRVLPGDALNFAVVDSKQESQNFGQSTVPSRQTEDQVGSLTHRLSLTHSFTPVPEDRSTSCGSDTRHTYMMSTFP